MDGYTSPFTVNEEMRMLIDSVSEKADRLGNLRNRNSRPHLLERKQNKFDFGGMYDVQTRQNQLLS